MTSQDVIQVVQVAQSLIAEVQALKGNAVSKTEMEGSNQALEGKIMKNRTLTVEGIIGSLVKALHAEIQGKVQGEIDTLKVAVTTLEQRDVAMQGTVSSATARIQQLGDAMAASAAAPATAGTDKGSILELKAIQNLEKYNGD